MAAFGELRELLAGRPSAATWEQICLILEAIEDGPTLREEILPYLQRTLQSWDPGLRIAPPSWSARAIQRQREEPRLALCSTLSLRALGTNATGAGSGWTAAHRDILRGLRAWSGLSQLWGLHIKGVGGLIGDLPSLEGLSLKSLTLEGCGAERAALEDLLGHICLRNLERLTLREVQIYEEGAHPTLMSVVESLHALPLRHVCFEVVSTSEKGDPWGRIRAEARWLHEQLGLAASAPPEPPPRLARDDLDALLAGPDAGNLRRLCLEDVQLQEDDLRALGELEGLIELDLGSSPCEPALWEFLAGEEGFAGLRVLRARMHDRNNKRLTMLLEGARLAQLRCVELSTGSYYKPSLVKKMVKRNPDLVVLL